MNQRVLHIDGSLNFRDLGGYQTDCGKMVKWGAVYRSAQLDRLTKRGIKDLVALNIKTVVDLRFTDESEKYPTIPAAVPNAEMLSWHDEQENDSGEKSQHMIRSWRDSLETNDPEQVREAMRLNYPHKLYTHSAIYRKMLIRLIDGGSPLVFHCAAGKDRTGVGAALILSLLGVDNNQIIEDYLLTQKEIEGRMQTWMAGGATNNENQNDFQSQLLQHPKELLKPIFDADKSYIETLLDYIKDTYGTFTNYAYQRLKLSKDEISALQASLLITV